MYFLLVQHRHNVVNKNEGIINSINRSVILYFCSEGISLLLSLNRLERNYSADEVII